jgi:hypothetical protein
VEHEYEIPADEMCPYIAKRSGDSGLRIVTGLINSIHQTAQWHCVTVIAVKKKPKVTFFFFFDLNCKD